MIWKKRGFVYCATGSKGWAALYAMMPTPILMEKENFIRIYVGVTTPDKFGRTISVDVNCDDPSQVVSVNDDEPVIDLGEPGNFDDSGAVPSCCLVKDGVEYLYYVGFQRAVKVPYLLFPGLCTRTPGGSFIRYSKSPLIDRRGGFSSLSLAAPFVLQDDGKFKMWYWIGKDWIHLNSKPYLHAWIGYAESDDAINWRAIKQDCIVPSAPAEFSVGRPWVVKEQGLYKMYYSVRFVDNGYRLGYAESPDGLKWTRKDDALGLKVSDSGWDSTMLCYPAVINVRSRTYMFYNGNNNGETGFGWAERLG